MLNNYIGQHLLVPFSDVVALLDHLCVLSDVWAAGEQAVVANVLQVEQHAVLVALMLSLVVA